MPKRVTIVLDDDMDKKLRVRQANKIKESQASYSFSKCLNDVLRKTLR